MELSNKPVAHPHAVLREEFDDWAVLFNLDTADAVGTNPVGVAVWQRLDGRRTLAEIVAEIGDEFADPPASLADEIAAFVDQLAAGGFVGTAGQ
jgi:SynChlorMet cassette protein ScmD